MSESKDTARQQSPARHDSVLLVIKSPGNRKVLQEFLAGLQLQGIAVTDADSLAQALRSDAHVRLALVDVSGFTADVWSLCEQVRASGIPFIVLSPAQAMNASHEALAYGALSIMQKPIAKKALVHLLGNLKAAPSSQHRSLRNTNKGRKASYGKGSSHPYPGYSGNR